MVAVAQLVESRIVIPVVVGSSPIGHPRNSESQSSDWLFLFGILSWICFTVPTGTQSIAT